MKINLEKTNLMLFNNCRSLDFNPNVLIFNQKIQLVEETRLLGLIVSSDLKWSANTKNLVNKANKHLWIISRLKKLGADPNSLCEIYRKQIRCLLELASPVWTGSITKNEIIQIERVQKCALHIILGHAYTTYQEALYLLNLDPLQTRRKHLALKFALKAENHPKFRTWFKPNPKFGKTRTLQPKYYPIRSSNWRLERSPIGYLTTLLNNHYS